MMRASLQQDNLYVNHQEIMCDPQDETLLHYNNGIVENPIIRVSHKATHNNKSLLDKPSDIKGKEDDNIGNERVANI